MGDDLDLAVQIYEPGNGEKVALLENWREIFKSVQPALDKSRLRKRRAVDTPPVEPEFADNEFPCDDDEEDEDSSDEMSDIMSTDNMADKDDAGDASNTTPEELGQSPQGVPMPVDSPSEKRGRKRKAEAPPEGPNKDNPGGDDATRVRTKRVASEASAKGAEKATRSATSSGPVRRSARQKK
jgi:hypothetical protein